MADTTDDRSRGTVVVAAASVIAAFRRLPETKNRTLEDIERDLRSERPEHIAAR